MQRLRLASEYLLWHTVPLLFCATQLFDAALLRPAAQRWLVMIVLLFAAGVTLFCASLAALGLGASAQLSKVTPTGGTVLILAWLNLAAWGILCRRKSSGD